MKISNKLNKEVSSLINSMVVWTYMETKASQEENTEEAHKCFTSKEEAREKLIALGFTDLKRS
ncbi:MAG: hypothetical protein WC055_00170 [Melioribacteraceae bacterium]